MANYSTSLKSWGSSGSEYPDNYNYAEGEQPVDAWDNFLTHHVITDLEHLVSLTNDRLESDIDTSDIGSPENGHLLFRDDTEELKIYSSTDSSWHRLLYADGDELSGDLDVNANSLKDSQGDLSVDSHMDVKDGKLHQEWASKFEGGTVQTGESVSLRAFELQDSETLNVTQAHLTDDGFTTAAPSGVELAIVPEGASSSSDTTTVLSGDGSTVYADERGTPHTSYTNSSGSAEIVMVALDNGDFNSGSGSNEQVFGGFIGRVA